ncbi:MAG: serine/threonine protein kinase [Alphaproteobacteria bacterium]|nr:serine/threonine protein kinase [Alphaproteobacteria bacterium]
MELEAGTRIDTWVVEKKLGGGAMGAVFLCHDAAAPGIRAAVKVISGQGMDDLELRFVKEAEILSQLDHPAIVRFQGCRLTGAHRYLVMEFVEGESLERALERGPLPEADVLRMARTLADALDHAHAKGVSHRDIKPANVVLHGPEREPTLVDFGIAVRDKGTRMTQQGFLLGTLPYIPPEALGGDDPDLNRWDLYSLGVVLYDCLSSTPAFASGGGPSAAQQARVIRAKLEIPHLDPGEGVSEGVRALIQDLTAADPEGRIGSAAELRDRVDALLDPSREAPARPVTAAAPTVQRRPWAMLAAAAAALMLVGLWAVTRGPALRDLELQVHGLGPDTPVEARVGERSGAGGAALAFAGLPLGPTEVIVAAGEGCSVEDCPGEGCSACCSWTRLSTEVADGDGPQTLEVQLDPPPGERDRSILFAIPQARDLEVVSLTFRAPDGSTAARTLAGHVKLKPDEYVLIAESGECPAEAQGCLASGACPAGCVSQVQDFGVPCGQGLVTHTLYLPLDRLVAEGPRGVAAGGAPTPPRSPAEAELKEILAELEQVKEVDAEAASGDPAAVLAAKQQQVDALVARVDALAASAPKEEREHVAGAKFAAGVALVTYANLADGLSEGEVADEPRRRQGLDRLKENLQRAQTGKWWCAWHGRSYKVLAQELPDDFDLEKLPEVKAAAEEE